ncbi:MAG: AMP-binding protein, partial [Bacteroidota bacterium]
MGWVFQYGKLVPQGVAGELCVGGAGVARGYLFRPELTAEKFVLNPYNQAERLYKSGDLVRMLKNGELEYLGRIDQQVKIRGYRIEIKEVESHLVANPMIKEAVVLAVKNTTGTDALCAYMVVSIDYDQQKLTRQLADALPDYMVPSYFMVIDDIPVTQNGKVNTRALPEPVFQQEQVVEARNETEQQLVRIWEETLKLDNIGITSNFFHVGGDSINAIKLINNVKESFGIEVRVADLYVNETIEKFSEHLSGIHQESANNEREQQILRDFEALKSQVLAAHPESEEIEDVYPMTEIQRGMVFNYLKNLGTGVYHDQFLFNLSYKNFDLNRFGKALKLLVDKHEMLRASFDIDNYEEFVQIIYQNPDLPLETEFLHGLSMDTCRERIKADLIEDINRPFDKNVRLLWRIKLYQLNESDFTVMLSFHHAILDGWSVASLTTELNNLYMTLSDNPDFVPVKLRSSYKDAVISEIYEKEATEKLDFWRSELEGYERLEMSFLSSHEKTGDMLIYKRSLDAKLLDSIQQMAIASNSSVKNILLGAYLCTLKYFSGNRDITVGLVTNNRPVKEDSDQILGCFLNTIPLRVNIDGEAAFSEFLAQVDSKVRGLKAYENVPLFEIANAIGEISKDKNPIFDTLFNFVNFHIYNDAVNGGEESDHAREQFSDGNQNTNTLFDFEVSATNNELTLLPKYDPVLISEEFVSRFCDYYLNVLDHLINRPADQINTSKVMPQEERRQILHDFNDNACPYEGELLMHQLFERSAETMPDNVAIDYRGEQLSYQHLNQRANQLAYSLRENGVSNGDMVGLIISRKAEMIISMLAIHKAGGAYVPLEPNLPSTRISNILENLSVKTVISDSSLTGKIAEVLTDDLETVYFADEQELTDEPDQLSQLNVLTAASIKDHDTHNPECTATSDQLAYIIFTSGSTGTPKGVMVKHKPVINIIEWINKTFEVTPDDKLLFITSMGFDLSVYDVFGTLATGACIRLMDYGEMSNPKHMLDVIIDEQITIWDSAPAAIQVLVPLFGHVDAKRAKSALRLIMLSGDWIPVAMPDQLRETFEGVEVLSLGGATEATIWSNYYRIGEVDDQWKSIP